VLRIAKAASLLLQVQRVLAERGIKG